METGQPILNGLEQRMTWSALLPLTLTWRDSWLEQKGETTPSIPCCLSCPSIIVASGWRGMQSNMTPQNGGKSSLRSLARWMFRRLWDGSGCCFSWATMPMRWLTIIWCCQPLTLWTKIDFYLFPIGGLVGSITAWSSLQWPWCTPRPCSIGWKKASCCHQVSLTNWWRACWNSDKPWNL